MKPYTVTTEVTTKYTIEVHAETETAAIEQTESLTLDQIQNGGEFVELVGVDATDAELLYPEDEDEDEESFSDLDIDPPGDVSTEPIEDAVIMPKDENDQSDQS